MKKNVMQDVVVQKRSIKDISIPKRKTSTSFEEKILSAKNENYEDKTSSKQSYNFDYNSDIESKQSKKGLYFSIFIFLIALLLGVSSLFTKATVIVKQKRDTLPISLSLSAKKDTPSTEFGYQIVSITSSKEETAVANGEKKALIKASGTIVIYNNTNTIQKLIATTRFETPNGLIFRIKDPVSVPAIKKVDGKSVPGSVEAVVYADKEGESYNIEKTDFTLPGFKNTPNYKNIYARSKTNMTGGFSGNTKVVEESTKAQIDNRLEEQLKTSMASEIMSQIPANFVGFKDGIEYQFEELSQGEASGSNVTLIKKAVASAVIFDKNNLTKEILKDLKEKNLITESDDIVIENIESINFKLSSTTKSAKNSDSISFKLEGDLNLVWSFDQGKLMDDLLGVNKNKINDLLKSKYPSIESAEIKIFPFWKTSLPLNKDKVEIKI